MHHILRGALGAVLVYPLAWHYYGSQPATAQSAASASKVRDGRPSAVASAEARSASIPVTAQPAPDDGAAKGAKVVREGAAPRPEPSAVQQRGRSVEPALSKPSEPDGAKVPFPAFSELQEAFGTMKDLQAVAHDPKALDERVQQTEHDPQKLAKLKAFAEQLVQLPPPAGERYLPSGNATRANPAR